MCHSTSDSDIETFQLIMVFRRPNLCENFPTEMMCFNVFFIEIYKSFFIGDFSFCYLKLLQHSRLNFVRTVSIMTFNIHICIRHIHSLKCILHIHQCLRSKQNTCQTWVHGRTAFRWWFHISGQSIYLQLVSSQITMPAHKWIKSFARSSQ